MNICARARVVRIGRNHVWIVFDHEIEVRQAELRKTQAREMLVPGDIVQAELRPDGSAFVLSCEPRRTKLERLTPAGRRKIMAANIDTLLIAAAFDRPAPNLNMIDELLAFTLLHGLDALLVFSKADLSSPAAAQDLISLYTGLGYDVYSIDARTGQGVDALAHALDGRDSLIVGASGVGKSTLFQALGGEALIGDVSEKTGRGKQTTTTGRLHRLKRGVLIDSPGIGEFSLDALKPAEIAALWVELRDLPAACRFTDCRHLREPHCAVRGALAEGRIALSRWSSYRRCYDRQESSPAPASKEWTKAIET